MFTRCPHCETLLELDAADLEWADGKVRCSECDAVFVVDEVADDAEDFGDDEVADDAGECRDDEMVDEDAVDDERLTETGVGWIILPAEEPETERDSEHATYVAAEDAAAWDSVGAVTSDPASNLDSRTGDDTQPDEHFDDDDRFAETSVYEPSPISFDVIAGGLNPAPPDVDAEPPGDESPEQEATTTTQSVAAGEQDGDWVTLLAELEQDDPGATGFVGPLPADATADPEQPATDAGTADPHLSESDFPGDSDPGDEFDDIAATDGEPGFADSSENDADELAERVAIGTDIDDEPAFEAATDVDESALENSTDANAVFALTSDHDRNDDSDSQDATTDMDEYPFGLVPSDEARSATSRMQHKRWAVAAVVLTVIGVAQLVHNNRHELATRPVLGSLVSGLYGAGLQPSWDVGALCYEKRASYAADGIMLIYAKLANRGNRALPYPQLHVTLSGRFATGRGTQAISHRVLEPDEYLLRDDAGERVAGGGHFEAFARLVDPGPEVTGYAVEACYRQTDATLHCSGGCVR